MSAENNTLEVGEPEAGRVLRAFGLVALGAVVLAMAWVAVGILRRDAQSAFGVAVAFAVLPMPLYLALVLWADRFEPEPKGLLALMFLWGAGSALAVAYTVNTAGGVFVADRFGWQAAEIYVPSVSAPVVEEIAKGAPLLALLALRRDQLNGLVDGVVYATTIALGFAMSENVLYYGRAALRDGTDGAVDLFALRGGWNAFIHPLFTAATGLAVARAATACRRARWPLVLAGLFAAMVLHSTWNTTLRLDSFDVVYFGIFLPLVAAVALLAWRSRRRQARTVATFVGTETDIAPAPAVRALLATPAGRRALRAIAHERAGIKGRRLAAAYGRAAVRLASLQHPGGGGRRPYADPARAEAVRHELALRRRQLLAAQALPVAD